jgi:putative ABC transport system permease protein
MTEHAIDISYWSMFFAILLVVPPLFFAWKLGLKQSRKIMVSTLRMVVQLGFVGVYLHFVFDLNNAVINILYLVFMAIIASFSAIRSVNFRWRVFIFYFLLAAFIPLLLIVLYFNYLILDLSNLFDARYLIPVGGMVLGNTLKTVIIGVDRYISDIQSQQSRYFSMLMYGASRSQALRPFFKTAINAAMNPILAAMATVGLVSLPGMMTGQILGGSLPLTAIKYQIAIMTAIFCNNFLSVWVILQITPGKIFNSYDLLNRAIFRK